MRWTIVGAGVGLGALAGVRESIGFAPAGAAAASATAAVSDVLNTHRPLFGDLRMRLAASFATDRQALAQVGDPFGPLPDRPTDHYLPAGIPGYADTQAYPSTPDMRKARALAQGAGRITVLYTCDTYRCAQSAQILKDDLAAIGLQIVVKSFAVPTMYAREARPGEPFDIGYYSWAVDYPDPAALLNPILDGSAGYPAFADPSYQRRLADAAQLSGPRRYLAYGKLDFQLARKGAPLIAAELAARGRTDVRAIAT